MSLFFLLNKLTIVFPINEIIDCTSGLQHESCVHVTETPAFSEIVFLLMISRRLWAFTPTGECTVELYARCWR